MVQVSHNHGSPYVTAKRASAGPPKEWWLWARGICHFCCMVNPALLLNSHQLSSSFDQDLKLGKRVDRNITNDS